MSVDLKKVSITNVLLGTIVCLLVFLCLEQKLSIEKSQATQERFYTLINTHFGHVEIENFKKEGRRIAFAEHFADQNLPIEEAHSGSKKLLTLGSDGIKAYLASSSGAGDVTRGIERFFSQSPLYSFALALQQYFPLQRLSEDSASSKSLVSIANVGASGSNPIKFSMQWVNSLSIEELKKIDFTKLDYSEFVDELTTRLEQKEAINSAESYGKKMAIKTFFPEVENELLSDQKVAGVSNPEYGVESCVAPMELTAGGLSIVSPSDLKAMARQIVCPQCEELIAELEALARDISAKLNG